MTGEREPDGLAAAYLARTVDGPVLLTVSDRLPAVTRQAVRDAGVDTVYVVGGTAAVSEEVAEELDDVEGVETVTRIFGFERDDTAAAVARFTVDGSDPADQVGTPQLTVGAQPCWRRAGGSASQTPSPTPWLPVRPPTPGASRCCCT